MSPWKKGQRERGGDPAEEARQQAGLGLMDLGGRAQRKVSRLAWAASPADGEGAGEAATALNWRGASLS